MKIIIGDNIFKSSYLVKRKYREIFDSVLALKECGKGYSEGQYQVAKYLKQRHEKRFLGICRYKNSKISNIMRLCSKLT